MQAHVSQGRCCQCPVSRSLLTHARAGDPQRVRQTSATEQQQSESVSRSVLSDSMTPWTVARQAPPSMGFSRREYWSGLPFPSPGDLPNPGIKPGSPALQADSLLSESPGKPKVCGNSSQQPRETNARN